MKEFTRHASHRHGYDGWALRLRGTSVVLNWSVCTTRREARELRDERSDLADDFEVVKVRIKVEVIE